MLFGRGEAPAWTDHPPFKSKPKLRNQFDSDAETTSSATEVGIWLWQPKTESIGVKCQFAHISRQKRSHRDHLALHYVFNLCQHGGRVISSLFITWLVGRFNFIYSGHLRQSQHLVFFFNTVTVSLTVPLVNLLIDVHLIASSSFKQNFVFKISSVVKYYYVHYMIWYVIFCCVFTIEVCNQLDVPPTLLNDNVI